jgi:hypothetical protein
LFPSKAILGDGSVRNIEKDTFVKFEVEFSEMDAQELQSMEEKAVKNWVEKIGESVVWGPEQELSLLRFDDWKGEYVRIEDGDDLVTEIDRRDGWTSKHQPFMQKLLIANLIPKLDMWPPSWLHKLQMMNGLHKGRLCP